MSVRIILGAMLIALLAGSPGATPAQGPAPRVIEITAERFEFWPSEVTMTEGEEVEFRLHSDDTLHGFRIVGTTTSVLVPKRGQGYAVARFTAGRPGRYTFECTRMCGAGHNFMRGVLVVRAAPEREPS